MGEAKALHEEEERKRQVTMEEAETYDWWAQFLTARLYAIKCMVKLDKPDPEICRVLGLTPDHLARLKVMNKVTK